MIICILIQVINTKKSIHNFFFDLLPNLYIAFVFEPWSLRNSYPLWSNCSIFIKNTVSFMNFYPNTIFSLTYYIISENRNKMREYWNISSMSKPKTKMNSLQKCGASHKRSGNLVTCVTDWLNRVTLTCWQSLYGPTWCKESSRLMSIDPLLVALSFHISHHHCFFLIKLTTGVNFLCFNYRRFQSACGDFIPPFTVIQLQGTRQCTFWVDCSTESHLSSGKVINVISSWKSLKDLQRFPKINKIH